MSKKPKKEKVIVTNKDVEQDINIKKVEETEEDKLAVQGYLVDFTYEKAKEKEGDIDIKPDAKEIAAACELSVKRVKEIIGELHKEEWLRDGKEEGSIKVDQFTFKVIHKGYTLCPFCSQELTFENQTITDKWGKVDPEGKFINYRFVCKNKQCKHEAIFDARVQGKRV